LLGDLLSQSFQNFETIIVDGHSQDQTVALAKASPLKPQVILSPKKNVSHQRNLGAGEARADWLVFFDADNSLPPYFLEGVKYNLTKNSLDCFTTYIKPDSQNPQDQTIATVSNLGITASILIKKPTAFGAVIGIKKTVFNQIAGFDPTISFQEDVDLVRKVVNLGYKFKIFSDPYIIYSFRRFRREGTLNLIRKFAKLQLNTFISIPETIAKDYPMLGGSYYQVDKKPSIARLKKIQETFNQLTKTQKQKLKNLLRFLLDTQ
jgi:glycosyltransferase involved in cell wall biosynthesis